MQQSAILGSGVKGLRRHDGKTLGKVILSGKGTVFVLEAEEL